MSPIRTSCRPPPPLHILQWTFNVVVLVPPGEIELEYNDHLYNYAVVIQPVLLRIIAALFEASALSTFTWRMECSTMHVEGSASEI